MKMFNKNETGMRAEGTFSGNRPKHNARKKIVLPVMLGVLALVLVLATAIGAVYVPFGQTARIILKNIGILKNATFQKGHEEIIFYVRFPGVLVAALVGAGLATSGVVMQGMFRNPMADPGILGVSSGAGLGAVIAIALRLNSKSVFFLPVFAAIGALVASYTVFRLSKRGGKIPVLTLVLSGIAVSMFLGAMTSIVLTTIHGDQIKEYLFWTTGGLTARRWEHVAMAVIPIIACIAILLAYSRDLNILLLGEEEAQAVGLNSAKTRKILLVLTSITTAAAVSVSGNISFVGLIVPHIMRLIVGHDHRILIPVSAVGGSIFLVGCDLIARAIPNPRGIGVGIVTSLIGAPYFLFLLIRTRKGGDAL